MKKIRTPLQDIDEDKILFQDIETDHQYAPYAKLKSIAVQYGLNSKPEIVDSKARRREYRRKLRAPDVMKVDFNGLNFDAIVLDRHGFPMHRLNHNDLFIIIKTVATSLAAFSLKFCAFNFFGDHHMPQMKLNAWCAEHGKEWYQAPKQLLREYNKHDVNPQTVDLFRVFWDVVIRKEHWAPYCMDMRMGEPVLEMETEGGIYLDRENIWRRLHSLQKEVQKQTIRALKLTRGAVINANSSQQLGTWFSKHEKIEIELTDEGNFVVDKNVLVALKDDNPVADCAFKIRQANGEIKYMENYLNALEDETYEKTATHSWIPIQISINSARTRRNTSQSRYHLNFQNSSEGAMQVQVVPKGCLGVKWDSTQVENIVHIYESKDDVRRRAYEEDEDWNEYVWLCNEVLGTNKTKDELDEKYPRGHPRAGQPTKRSRSIQIPHWTVYKQYKTGKLGLNFGMGLRLFCELFGLTMDVGISTLSDIHRACPAIHELQRRVAYDLEKIGFVTDSFGHRYSGPVRLAYKVVAYLIQGCGTGSLPKAQIRANWKSIRSFDRYMPKSATKCGVLCMTTHDDNISRIDLRLGPERILQLLQKMYFNMTERFSPKFDNIPLRAKLYLTRTNFGSDTLEEIDITDTKKILNYCEL